MRGLRFPRSLPPPLFLDWLVFFHLLLAVSLLSDVFGVFLGILSGKFSTNLRTETCLNGSLVLLKEKAPSTPDYPFVILNSLLIRVPIKIHRAYLC
jgi:hypothetical protein